MIQHIAMISGWLGVALVFISLSIQTYLIVVKKINSIDYLMLVQAIIIIASLFWIVYAFVGSQVYWQTGVSNILIELFTILFLILTIVKRKKQ